VNHSGIVNLDFDKLVVNLKSLSHTADKGNMEVFVPIEILIDSAEIVEPAFFQFHVGRKRPHKAFDTFVIVPKKTFHAVRVEVYSIDVPQPYYFVGIAEVAIFYFDHFVFD
jgi:hypothetical protein